MKQIHQNTHRARKLFAVRASYNIGVLRAGSETASPLNVIGLPL